MAHSQILPYTSSLHVDRIREFINRSKIPKYVVIGSKIQEVDSYFGSYVYLKNSLEIYQVIISSFHDIQDLFTMYQLVKIDPEKGNLVKRLMTIELRNTMPAQARESHLSVDGKPIGFGKDLLDYILPTNPAAKAKAQ